MYIEDLSGLKVGRLTVTKFSGAKTFRCGQRHYFWDCLCECGNKIVVRAGSLKNGRTKSCGCYQRERTSKTNTTHGASKGYKRHPMYQTWVGMKSRCENPKEKCFPLYGGRGIKILWPNYESFARDMEPTWKRSLTIERKDNNGPYSKANCRWATRKEQSRNTRTNRLLCLNGENLPVRAWAERLHIHHDALYSRLRLGWSVEKALTTP